MGSKSSTRAGNDPFTILTKWTEGDLKFWNDQKVMDQGHKDYRGPSEDLPMSPKLWKYKVSAYEETVREMVKNERNITVLEGNIKKH